MNPHMYPGSLYLTPLCCLYLSTGDAASLSPITWIASSLPPLPPLPQDPFLFKKMNVGNGNLHLVRTWLISLVEQFWYSLLLLTLKMR